MAEITAALVKELRERTGAGMMDCKKALTEAGGDMEKAIELLSARFGQPDNATAYSYYVSQGFGYRQIEEQKIKEKKYASEQERMEKNFYVSLILPKDGPGYVEHWITCKRRANNMIMRGQINGTVYSIKNGLKKLREHNRKFKGEESSANSNIE